MKRKSHPVAVTIICSFLGSWAFGQIMVDPTFTYQGRLETSGVPANGQHDFEFRLFDSATLGTQVGTSICMDQLNVQDGLFSVGLNFGQQFTGAAFWLEIRVRADGVVGNCSTGAFTTLTPRQRLTGTPYALALPGLWTLSSGSIPSVIGGFAENSVLNGAIGAVIAGGGNVAEANVVTDAFGVVSGGTRNRAGDSAGTSTDHPFATVGGGIGNVAGAASSTVGGGNSNLASGNDSSIGGGINNLAGGPASTVAGGSTNRATAPNTTIAGGTNNTASGQVTAIGGGGSNTASGDLSTVCGGSGNTASGLLSAIGGGGGNQASDAFATVGGGKDNRASGGRSTVAGGAANSASNGFSTIGGGVGNTASGPSTTVSGGNGNTASGNDATVGGGIINSSSGAGATIGGGRENTANQNMATIGGGNGNQATNFDATVAGGFHNIAAGVRSTVAGGGDNQATSYFSAVPGGEFNKAGGFHSFATGRRAIVRDATATGDFNGDEGTFVWADDTDIDFVSTGPRQFLIRATNGVAINANDPLGFTLAVNGEAAKPGGGSWATYSDSRLKQDIAPIGGALALAMSLRGVTFQYSAEAIAKGRGVSGRQLGFVAQEVEQAVPEWVGEDNEGVKHITERGATALLIEAMRELRAENACALAERDVEIARMREDFASKIKELQSRIDRQNVRPTVNR